MKRSRLFTGTALLVVLGLAAMAGASVTVARDADHTVARDADPNAAQKTYKRRCTNYKCKIVSESTKPIFKCPHCGSSTVPVT